MGLTRIGALTLNSGENVAADVLLDIANNNGYVICGTNPQKLVKFNPTSLTRTSALNTSAAASGTMRHNSQIDTSNGFIYIHDSSTTEYKIQLSDFTEVSSSSSGSITYPFSSAIDVTNQRSYWGRSPNSAFGAIYKHHLDNPATWNVGSLSAPRQPYSMCGDFTNSYLYAGCNQSTNNGVIKKWNTATYTVDLEVSTGAFNELRDAAIDTVNGFAYFLSQNTAKLFKYRLSDDTIVNVLNLSGITNPYSCVIDVGGQYLYIATSESPSVIVQVDLLTFVVVDTLTLNSGENSANCVAIDTTNFALYAGTNTAPVIVVKIGIDEREVVVPVNYVSSVIEVQDTNGVSYNYATTSDGFLKRLENGTDFDGNDIAHEFQIGDMGLYKDTLWEETMIRNIRLYTVSKEVTANSIAGVHYGDTRETGTAFTMSPSKSGYRVTFPDKDQGLGSHLFHSLKFSMTTDDETIGFEPLFINLVYKTTRGI